MAELEAQREVCKVNEDGTLAVAGGAGQQRHGGVVQALGLHMAAGEREPAVRGLLQFLGEVVEGLLGDGRELRLGVQQAVGGDDGEDFRVGLRDGVVLEVEAIAGEPEARGAGSGFPEREAFPAVGRELREQRRGRERGGLHQRKRQRQVVEPPSVGR